MSFKDLYRNAMRFLGNFLLAFLVDALCRTLRINIINGTPMSSLENQNRNCVLAFWHGAMLLPWYIGKNKGLAALVSQSKDGELLARVLKKWDYYVVRGSSRRGGALAMRELISLLNDKKNVAITPDGPTGPREKFKAGAVVAAKKCGVPVILIGAAAENKRNLHSWDRFEIPMPFTRVNVVCSDPLYIDPELTFDETSQKIIECENLLNTLQSEAEKF